MATPSTGHDRDTAGASRRRRLYIRVGIAGFFLVAFAIVPAYLAWQPTFMERYPAFEMGYDTWSESLHARVACQECHVPPGAISQAAYGARMLGEFYVSIVAPEREPDLFRPPVNEACDRCHTDLRTVSPSGDLNIPHRAHVEMLGMDCIDCHDFLLHETTAADKHIPSMAGCLTCHDGEAAKNDCAACHTDKDPPETHLESEWLITHAEQPAEECVSCHEWTEHWCSDCHEVRPVSHGEDWRAQHRHVVAERRNCEACHAGVFCDRCHGEVPQLNYDSTLTIVR